MVIRRRLLPEGRREQIDAHGRRHGREGFFREGMPSRWEHCKKRGRGERKYEAVGLGVDDNMTYELSMGIFYG